MDSNHPSSPEKSQDMHPRRSMAEWKWKGATIVFFITSCINGYDVSDVANIQPRLYKAFGNIELLLWIGLSYSLANFAVLSYARKITHVIDLRWIYLSHMVVFMAGAAVAGLRRSVQFG